VSLPINLVSGRVTGILHLPGQEWLEIFLAAKAEAENYKAQQEEELGESELEELQNFWRLPRTSSQSNPTAMQSQRSSKAKNSLRQQ